jgi:hypothetical protein
MPKSRNGNTPSIPLPLLGSPLGSGGYVGYIGRKRRLFGLYCPTLALLFEFEEDLRQVERTWLL